MKLEREDQLQVLPRGEGESSLPELKLTEAVKSPEPIVKVEPNKPITSEDSIIQPYREFTVVLAKDVPEEIQILDRQGKKLEGLINTQTMILDWPAQKKRARAEDFTYMSFYPNDTYNTKGLNSFPARLQDAVKVFIEERGKSGNVLGNRLEIPNEAWQLDTNRLGEIRTRTGDEFVILRRSRGDWIGFQTKNEQGIELIPRRWGRLDSVDDWAIRLPRNIQEIINLMRSINQDATFAEQLKNGYSAVVLKDRLTITKSGQKIEDAEFTDRVAGIGNNVCQDPKSPWIVYYCQTENPKTMFRLDTTKDPTAWQTEDVELPKEYKNRV